uniref:Uncharacterized protein n=1 Tax=Anguilla anguilla TaxID=7936 RepID=A0A0E9U3G5_ANGAN
MLGEHQLSKLHLKATQAFLMSGGLCFVQNPNFVIYTI